MLSRGTRGGWYLLTWTTYGTWLPGDPRAFVSRVKQENGSYEIHNQVGTPFDRDRPVVRELASARMKGDEVVLDEQAAGVCLEGIREACVNGDLLLRIAAIMRTHCHAVVFSQREEGAAVLQRFKGVSSRRMTQACGKPGAGTWWTRHGSRRLLDTPNSFERAVEYVRNQERPLVLFEEEIPRRAGGGSATPG